jgi:hypothetical protein
MNVAAIIDDEWDRLVRGAASRKPAKIMARMLQKSPRQVYNIRNGTSEPKGRDLMVLARECPELRMAVLRWLGMAPGPQAIEARRLIEAALAAMPEAGDAANE